MIVRPITFPEVDSEVLIRIKAVDHCWVIMDKSSLSSLLFLTVGSCSLTMVNLWITYCLLH